MRPVSWQSFFANWVYDGYVGDLQITHADGSIERGPVKMVRQESYDNVFDFIWLARKIDPRADWQRTDCTSLKVSDLNTTIWSNDKGYTWFQDGGFAEIYRKNAEHLDPSDVIGLTNDEVRQSRAWIYGIPLDSDWKKVVERVVDDLGADGVASAEEQRQVLREAHEFA